MTYIIMKVIFYDFIKNALIIFGANAIFIKIKPVFNHKILSKTWFIKYFKISIGFIFKFEMKVYKMYNIMIKICIKNVNQPAKLM